MNGDPSLARRQVWLPVLLILLGVWLRAPLLFADSALDVDEALFASFARQISHEGNPLLLGQPVDKPPLLFYVVAASFKLSGQPVAWAARLPNFLASVV
ncbi:MAG: hypothetical protein JW910_04940, partial [Anaerolineae bacterium]|nr:hypothetical protein [Anaerolineae bacterium]